MVGGKGEERKGVWVYLHCHETALFSSSEPPSCQHSWICRVADYLSLRSTKYWYCDGYGKSRKCSTFIHPLYFFFLNQMCRGISQLTRDKIVWLALIERLRNCGDIPLPPDCHALEHSSSTLESTVVSATQASDSWRLPRKIGKPILNPSNGQSILGLDIFDTWLLIVYASGLIYLWDIREGAPRRGYCDNLDLRAPGRRTLYIASLVHGSQQVLLAISSGTSK